jgi:RecA/RadA recombinase
MSFEKFRKEINKASEKAGIPINSPPPSFWIDMGSLLLNKIATGSYSKGWAGGRMGAIGGPSGSGKSFLIANATVAAQKQGFAILILDSENAMDDDYMSAVGADVDAENYFYRSVTTIQEAVQEFSAFTKMYREYGLTDKVFVAIDSLDMLMTENQRETYEKGETKGDQGQGVKQLKDMLKSMVQDIKTLPFTIVCTKQVYKEQDRIAALVEPYVFTEGLKFAFSQILMITKLMLKTDDVEGGSKEDKTDKYAGIWLKAKGYKTRFTKPFQQVKIQVPWDTGMDRYSGMLDVAKSVGIVEQNGAWYTFGDKKFQKKDFHLYQEEIVNILIDRDDKIIEVEIEEKDAPPDSKESKVSRQRAKLQAQIESHAENEE